MEYKTSTIIKTSSGSGSVSGSDDFTVSGYLTRWDEVDLVGDTTVRGSFANTIADNKDGLPLLWSHEFRLPPIGKVLAMREDNTGVFFISSIVSTQLGADVKKLVSSGIVSGVSYGYNIKDSDYRTIGGQRVRRLKAVDIMEVSICTFPALPSARLTGSKADAILIAEVETLKAAGLPVRVEMLKRAALARIRIEERALRTMADIRRAETV